MRTAKQMAELFGALDPNEKVWCTFITKDDIRQAFSNVEYTDENDELIETDGFVTDEVMEQVVTSIDNDEYLWERFNENYNETCREIIAEIFSKKEKAKEDKDLWDKEGEENATSKND